MGTWEALGRGDGEGEGEVMLMTGDDTEREAIASTVDSGAVGAVGPEHWETCF